MLIFYLPRPYFSCFDFKPFTDLKSYVLCLDKILGGINRIDINRFILRIMAQNNWKKNSKNRIENIWMINYDKEQRKENNWQHRT